MITTEIQNLITRKKAEFDELSQSRAKVLSRIDELEARLKNERFELTQIDERLASATADQISLEIISKELGQEPTTSDGNPDGIAQKLPLPVLETSDSFNFDSADMTDGEPRARELTIEARREIAKALFKDGPKTTAELVTVLKKSSVIFPEHNAIANLSAILSRTSFFVSERRMWRLDLEKLKEKQASPR